MKVLFFFAGVKLVLVDDEPDLDLSVSVAQSQTSSGKVGHRTNGRVGRKRPANEPNVHF